MRNLIIGPAYPLRGGIANFNLALCHAFHKKNIASDIISFSMQYPSFLFPGKTQTEDGPVPEGIRISQDINSVNPISWIHTGWKIFKTKPDYIVVAFWMPFMAPALGTIARIARRNGIKVIAVTHNVIPHEHHFYDKCLLQYFINSCDGFITLAKSVLDDLSKFTGNTHKQFIPHPVYDIFGEKTERPAAIKHLGLNENDRHLLFFGLVRHYKGLDLLLNAMAFDKIKKLNIKLIVAGEFYEDKTIYEKIIADNRLQENIIINDKFIPGDEVRFYFAVADMVVQPYHTATQSGVTQIAYHFERPMLVTDVGGLAEIVPHEKVGYVTQTTPESIADAILDFYSMSREKEFSACAAIEKNKFSWSNMVDGIEKMVKNL
ncbi:MAG: glycosyltransferase [Bacteroidia bacterium]|nr:glycosyltransferase [Bacteroidia bacterium]